MHTPQSITGWNRFNCFQYLDKLPLFHTYTRRETWPIFLLSKMSYFDLEISKNIFETFPMQLFIIKNFYRQDNKFNSRANKYRESLLYTRKFTNLIVASPMLIFKSQQFNQCSNQHTIVHAQSSGLTWPFRRKTSAARAQIKSTPGRRGAASCV